MVIYLFLAFYKKKTNKKRSNNAKTNTIFKHLVVVVASNRMHLHRSQSNSHFFFMLLKDNLMSQTIVSFHLIESNQIPYDFFSIPRRDDKTCK